MASSTTSAAHDSPAPRPDTDGIAATVRATLREYATADPRSLGLFRIIFGLFLLIDLVRRLPDAVFFYTNDGMLPNHGAIYRPMSGHLFSIYHAFSTHGEVLVAFALTALAYLAYMVGFKTRVFQVVVLVLVTSLHSRNIMLENGGDVVANLLALWTCFLPLGRRFSVDALLASFREVQEHNSHELVGRDVPFTDRRPFTSLAFAAIVLNLACIYYFNTIHKDGLPWRQGTSVHFVLWADRLVNPLGVSLRSWLPGIAMQVMTMGTLVIESSITLLLISPFFIRSCRRVAALMIIALHCGFQTVGHFGLFSFVMMLHSILLMGPEDWDALADRMRVRLPARIIYYDNSCGVCHLLARLLRRLDHLGKLTIRGNDDPSLLPPGVAPEEVLDTLIVADETNTIAWRRAEGIAQIFRALPFGIYIARWIELPGIRGALTSFYSAFAARRHIVSQELGFAACGIPQDLGGAGLPTPPALRPPLFGPWTGRLRELTVLVFVVAEASQVLAENRKVPSLISLKTRQPEVLAAIAQYPRLFQGWSMFAPIPPNDDGKIVVDAVTADGRHFDPLTGGGPVDFSLPDERHGMLMTQFWYELHDRLRRDANARYREHFRDWVMNWHYLYHRPPSDKIVSFKAYWVSRSTQAPFGRQREASKQQQFFEGGAAQSERAADKPLLPLPIGSGTNGRPMPLPRLPLTPKP